MKRSSLIVALTAPLLGLASTSAFAHDHKDAQATAAAQITLEQAIRTALQKHDGSRAMKAEMDVHKGQARYEVKVLGHDQKVYAVYIDPQSGNVLRDQEDLDD